MLTLFKTTCSSDWKGRPTHNLKILGHGTFEELVAVMNTNIKEFQANDLKFDKEFAKDEDEPIPTYGEDGWSIAYTRWEMKHPEPSPDRVCQREFVDSGCSDGDWSSVVYHIMDNAKSSN